MEESLSPLQQIKTTFACQEQDIRTYSPLALAYIGDGIYELIIRTVIMQQGNRSPESLHKKASALVKAETQCRLYTIWEEELTKEEQNVLRRGRNARSYTKAKNASVADYRKATGVEALFGYLYLTDQFPRAVELLKSGLEKAELTI